MSDGARVCAIVGATAVGKTKVSLTVAESLDAEIVSIDSMQVYTGLDIGTAKVGAAERARVPHHLVDIRPPEVEVTAAEFQSLAREVIAEIASRGKVPLLVGGSGLYFRAVVDDLTFPARSAEIRSALESEKEELGAEALHARLAEVDPSAAARIEPGNARRTVRALEVIELTGRLFSENNTWDEYRSIYDLRVAGLTRTREELYDRIERRVASMLRAGLIEEARGFEGTLSLTARHALGYKQILDRPGVAPEALEAEIVRATKRFARRQESWFRSDPRVKWFDAGREGVAHELVSYFRA